MVRGKRESRRKALREAGPELHEFELTVRFPQRRKPDFKTWRFEMISLNPCGIQLSTKSPLARRQKKGCPPSADNKKNLRRSKRQGAMQYALGRMVSVFDGRKARREDRQEPKRVMAK